MVRRKERTYEDYEELGRYLEAAEEDVRRAQRKTLDMIRGLKPLSEDRPVTMETRPAPTSHDRRILELVIILDYLRSELAMDFHAEVPESEVPPDRPRTPSPFDG